MKLAAAIPLAIGILLVGACTKTVITPRPALSPAQAGGVRAVMRRHVTNAAEAGEGDVLLQRLRQRVVASPDDLTARLELASAYEQRGHLEMAIEHYRSAAARYPDNAHIPVALAKSLRALGLRLQALETLEAWATAHPDAPANVHAWAGILRDENGRVQDAEASYRAALALDPKSSSLRNNLGYNLLVQGRLDAAAAELRAALALEPGSEIARNNLGIALASKPREAVLQWQSNSDPASAHNNLAAVMIEQGRYGEARSELQIALRYRKDHPAVLSNLQLLSELDGPPAGNRTPPSGSRWKRFASGLKKVIIGIEDKDRREETVKTASTER